MSEVQNMSSVSTFESDRISANHRSYIEALKAGDIPTILSHYCEDAVVMPPNETTLYGKVEIQEWYEDYFEHFVVGTYSVTEREVRLLADGWAVERWAQMIAIQPKKGGARIRDDGRSLVLWRHEPDGSWKMFQRMFNSIRPIGSGTSRFLSRMTRK